MPHDTLDCAYVPIPSATNQANKRLVLTYQRELERADALGVADALGRYVTTDYRWRSVYPFEAQRGAEAVAETFYRPLYSAWTHLHRRPDIFFAGASVFGGQWVVSMGHFAGTFARSWMGIPATGRMAFLRYCEFHRVEAGKIAETYLHTDLIHVMKQAGIDPLPPQTGAEFVWPGPKTHDGLVMKPQSEAESAKTLELIQRMARDLSAHPAVDMDPEVLARTWHEQMIWYGPSGIGSTLGIDGFKRHHQQPFRKALYGTRVFNGHKARLSEGCYGGWVGWPSLSMRVTGGGFMGLPATNAEIDMRVVDLYRREGERIAENWVFIDLPYTLKQQGLDIFERTRELYAT